MIMKELEEMEELEDIRIYDEAKIKDKGERIPMEEAFNMTQRRPGLTFDYAERLSEIIKYEITRQDMSFDVSQARVSEVIKNAKSFGFTLDQIKKIFINAGVRYTLI